MTSRLLSAPAAEPVTLADLKRHLEIDDTASDDFLTPLIVVARAAVERLTGRLMITQSWRLSLDAVPDDGLVRLPVGPVQTVSAVRVYDGLGGSVVWPGSGYTLDLVGEPARLLFHGSLPMPGRRLAGIEIDVVAGYGASVAAVPADLVQAVKLLAAHWYATRGDVEAGGIPADVAALTGGYRRPRLVA